VKPNDLLDTFLRELDVEDELDVAGTLALAAGSAEPPPPLRDRILGAIRSTHRFDELEAQLATILDLPAAAVRDLLLAIDGGRKERGGRWEDSPMPGVELLHFDGGPAVADAITGFVRIAPGAEFPHHEHVGEETVVVLQGACRDSSGTVHGRGAVVRMQPGTAHSLVALGPIPLVYTAVVQRGLKIGGSFIGPDDAGA
jgi:hypothetical protein